MIYSLESRQCKLDDQDQIDGEKIKSQEKHKREEIEIEREGLREMMMKREEGDGERL